MQPWAAAASRPNLHKKDKRAALVPTPITPHWKHPLLVSTALLFLERCLCAGSSWFEQRARILSVIAPRYEEAACIKAAMTPFWSGHSTHPHLQLFARVGRCKPVTHCLSLQDVDGKDEDHVDEDYRGDENGDEEMMMMIMTQASPLPIVLLCINRSARKLVLIPLTQVFAPPCQKVSFC